MNVIVGNYTVGKIFTLAFIHYFHLSYAYMQMHRLTICRSQTLSLELMQTQIMNLISFRSIKWDCTYGIIPASSMTL